MILYWYIHWFWITILIVYTSVAQTAKQPESMTTHSAHNESTSNATKTMKQHSVDAPTVHPATTRTNGEDALVTTTIPPSSNSNNTASNDSNRSTWNATSEQIRNDTTNMSISVIDANLTSTVGSSASLINVSLVDNDNLTTLEASFREPDNESMLAFDHMAAPTNNSGGSQLSAAGITSISLGCVVLVAIVTGASYMWYRSRGFNRPQVLNDRCSNLDSSGYIDDTSDNSEEMYSLDNDSFLNSLEAMTIQNYWTDAVKHTKL